MDSKVKIYIEGAENEFRLARAILNLSEKENLKIELLANPDDTFYSAVISHCYYSIFYSAKAILLTKGIQTKVPNEHKKTYDEFKKNFVDNGLLDKHLIEIYDDLIVKADELLKLFADEKLLFLIDKIIDSCEKGMPIGNLISQLFANIYLNELDRFVKHELKVKFYIRYMDDFIILDKDKKKLHEFKIKISEFLNSLKLEMHDKKCIIFPSELGVDFLGYVIYKNYKLARKSTVKKSLKNLRKKIENYETGRINFEKLSESINSWNAYLNFGNAYSLKKSLYNKYLKNAM